MFSSAIHCHRLPRSSIGSLTSGMVTSSRHRSCAGLLFEFERYRSHSPDRTAETPTEDDAEMPLFFKPRLDMFPVPRSLRGTRIWPSAHVARPPDGCFGISSIAPLLAPSYTVITYDPGSAAEHDRRSRPGWRAGSGGRDDRRVLEAVGKGPAHVFGSSGGAVTGLRLIPLPRPGSNPRCPRGATRPALARSRRSELRNARHLQHVPPLGIKPPGGSSPDHRHGDPQTTPSIRSFAISRRGCHPVNASSAMGFSPSPSTSPTSQRCKRRRLESLSPEERLPKVSSPSGRPSLLANAWAPATDRFSRWACWLHQSPEGFAGVLQRAFEITHSKHP